MCVLLNAPQDLCLTKVYAAATNAGRGRTQQLSSSVCRVLLGSTALVRGAPRQWKAVASCVEVCSTFIIHRLLLCSSHNHRTGFSENQFCPLGTPSGGFPVNTGNATDSLSGAGFLPPTSSSIGQIDKGIVKEEAAKEKKQETFYISASIILGTMATLWAGIGCCFEQLLPTSVARGLARCDMFSHSHFSKTLPRIMICHSTVLGGLTTLFSLIAAVFVLAFALIENSEEIWDYAGQYAAIDSELCKWQSLAGGCVSLLCYF